MISDFFEWRFDQRIKKRSEIVDNVDYNGDGDKFDVLWTNDGSIRETNNNGW